MQDVALTWHAWKRYCAPGPWAFVGNSGSRNCISHSSKKRLDDSNCSSTSTAGSCSSAMWSLKNVRCIQVHILEYHGLLLEVHLIACCLYCSYQSLDTHKTSSHVNTGHGTILGAPTQRGH